MFSSILFYS